MSDAEQREEAVFEAALQLHGAQRGAYLDQACAGDVALRERIEGLLGALERAGGLLDEPAVTREQASHAVVIPPTAQPGDHIGSYKLLQQIGEGGCGVVYMAEQTQPVKRRVALKILKLGMDTKQVIARFEAERQALALMDHPNIAKVLDAGSTDTGRPYFVMELVRGVKITEFCDENQLPMRQRLELFIQVCQAIQHAHQKGIIHRDLKPSNILVSVNDGVPVPKVIDFGIAKATTGQPLTDKTLFTAFEQFIGTPAYMSPEQAVMTSLDIDTRTDIYSLGVLLYELLTGQTPFDTKELLEAGFDEMRRTIREKEPARPSTRLSTMVEGELTTTAKRRHIEPPKLLHLVRGDLDWIVMKCLEKDRARRYETANGVARDIERHLNCEPVVARPPSRWYEFQKTVRRHKFGFAAGAAVTLVLAVGVLGSTWQAVRATRAERAQSSLRQKAEANEKKVQTEAAKSEQVSRFLRTMLRSAGPSVALGRDATMLREIVDQTADNLGRELVGQPEVEAEIRQILGQVYNDIDDVDKAIAQYQSAVSLLEASSPATDEDLIDTLEVLGVALHRWGRHAEAQAAARRAMALAESKFGLDNTNTASAYAAFGQILGDEWRGSRNGYYRPGPGENMEAKRAESERILRRVLQVFQKAEGERSSRVAMTLQNILVVTTYTAEKMPLAIKIVEIRRALYPEGHPLLALALNNLGVQQRNAGDYAAAEASFRQALAIDQKFLGEWHTRSHWTLQNLGETLEKRGNFPQAEAIFKRAHEIHRKRFPEPSTWQFANVERVSRVLCAQGKFDEAEALLQDFCRRLEPATNSNELLFDAYLTLFKLNDMAGRFAQAEEVCQKIVTVVPQEGTVLNKLAWTMVPAVTQAGRDSGIAVEMARRAVAATDRKEPNFLDTLAAAYGAANQFTNAVLVQREAMALLHDEAQKQDFARRLALYEAGLPYRDHDVLAGSASALLASGEFVRAESLARECLALREKAIPDNWATFHTRAIVGMALLGQNKPEAAERWLLEGYQGMKQREGQFPCACNTPLREPLRGLVQLYKAWGKSDQAAVWIQKLTDFDKPAAESTPAGNTP